MNNGRSHARADDVSGAVSPEAAAADFVVRSSASALFGQPPGAGEQLGTDWEMATAAAERLGLSALFHGTVEPAAERWRVPAASVNLLRAAYLWGLHTRREGHRQLRELVPALNAAGVSVILLKGMQAAETLYPDPARRAMHDIDLLVRGDDLGPSADVLRALGYRPDDSGPSKFSKHLPPFVRTDSLQIEVHFDLVSTAGPAGLNLTRVWEESRTGQIAGVGIRVLSREDALVHACLHLAHDHGFQRPFPGLYDVALMLHEWRRELDWGRVAQLAAEGGGYAYVRCALRLVAHALDITLCDESEEHFPANPTDDALFGALHSMILLPPVELPHTYREWNRRRGVLAKTRLLAGGLRSSARHIRETADADDGGHSPGYARRATSLFGQACRAVAAIALRPRRLAPGLEQDRRSQPVREWRERTASDAERVARRRNSAVSTDATGS